MTSSPSQRPDSSTLSDAKRKLLEQRLRGKTSGRRPESTDPARVPLHTEPGPIPLADTQKGMWLHALMYPNDTAHHVPRVFRLHGDLDVPALRQAVDLLVKRHDALGIAISRQGLMQRTTTSDVFRHHEMPGASLQQLEDQARAILTRPFRPAEGHLFQVHLLQSSADTPAILLLHAHHLVVDAHSLDLLLRELSLAYSGRSRDLPALPVGFLDWVAWMHGQAKTAQRCQRYWQDALAGCSAPKDLPMRRRVPGSGKPRGTLIFRGVPTELLQGAIQAAAGFGVTPYVFFLSVFFALLYRHTNQRDLVVGSPFSLRSGPDTQCLAGYFLHTMVLRLLADPRRPFAEWVAQVAEVVEGANRHAHMPLDDLIRLLNPERDAEGHALFKQAFIYAHTEQVLNLSGLRAEELRMASGSTVFDFTFFVLNTEGRLELGIECDAARYHSPCLEAFMQQYELLLSGVVADPAVAIAQFPLVGAGEAPSHPEAPPSLTPVHKLIGEQAGRFPARTALQTPEGAYSYESLWQRAHTIAAHLLEAGLVRGDRVHLYLEPGLDLIAAMVACLSQGAAYVPLDPAYPPQRILAILANSGPGLLLTTRDHASRIPIPPDQQVVEADAISRVSTPVPSPEVSLEEAAYVIYTSGSTGAPKGVVVSHGNLAYSTAARLTVYDQPVGAFLLLSSPAFDSSVAGIYWTLCTGGRLCIPAAEKVRDVEALGELIRTGSITHLLCVPSLYARLAALPETPLRGLTLSVVAGEACPSSLVRDHYAVYPDLPLYNEYGPTEMSVWSLVHRCTVDDEDPVPIGRPIPGCGAEVVTATGARCPPGIPGELLLSGPGLTLGYLNLPDATAERYVNRADGTPAYCTGDMVLQRGDGCFLFLGRNDHQVKLRGYRIECGEIECVLRRIPGITDAAVIATEHPDLLYALSALPPGEADRYLGAVEDPGEHHQQADHAQRLRRLTVAQRIHLFRALPKTTSRNVRLVAFYTHRGASPAEADLRASLADNLPDYMMPTALVPLDRFPLMPNGKVDRAALPALQKPTATSSAPTTRTPTLQESRMIEVWQSVLGVSPVGLDANFFHLGGHSLLVIELVEAIRRDLGEPVSASLVFRCPTPETLVRGMASGSRPACGTHLFDIQPRGTQPPLFFAQPTKFANVLAEGLGPNQPLYGFRALEPTPEAVGIRFPDFADLARRFIAEMRAVQPSGPYRLAGYSFGAIMVFEVARELERQNIPVEILLLLEPTPLWTYQWGPLRWELRTSDASPRDLSPYEAGWRWLRESHPFGPLFYRRLIRGLGVLPLRRLQVRWARRRQARGLPLSTSLIQAVTLQERNRLLQDYIPGPCHARTQLIKGDQSPYDAEIFWRPYLAGPLCVYTIPSGHWDMSRNQEARTHVVELVQQALSQPACTPPRESM